MSRLFSILPAAIDLAVRRIVIPVTGVIPVLVRTGALFLLFAVLWAALLGALVLRPALLDEAWAALGSLPLPVQGLAWLLFLPLTGALWAWSLDWPVVLRALVVIGIAGWNLLVFLPRREAGATGPAAGSAPGPGSGAPAAPANPVTPAA